MYALYPSNQISKQTPELFRAAEKTLEKRLASGGGQTGWSRAWMVNFYARLLNGDECYEHINSLLQKQITNSLLCLHPPHVFQIDGNLGVASGISEMLLQSHETGIIHMLPALPSAWNIGSVRGLKARGGFEIDMEWEDGILLAAKISGTPQTGAKLKFGGKTVEFEIPENGVYEIDTMSH